MAGGVRHNEYPAHIMPADFRVMLEDGHVDLTYAYGLNPRVRLEKRYRSSRCVFERMVKGIMARCENFLSSMAIRCR